MTLTFHELTPIQLDFLKELSNIGGGNAATSLSQMVDRSIRMEVPMVQILSYDNIFEDILGEEEPVHAISIRALGDIPGNFLFVIEEDYAIDLIRMVMGSSIGEVDELGISALQEICNILCSSYANAISRLLNISMASSVPAYVKDMFGAILPSIYMESGQYEEQLLTIENYFYSNNNRIRTHLFFVPQPGILEELFYRMGLNNI